MDQQYTAPITPIASLNTAYDTMRTAYDALGSCDLLHSDYPHALYVAASNLDRIASALRSRVLLCESLAALGSALTVLR